MPPSDSPPKPYSLRLSKNQKMVINGLLPKFYGLQPMVEHPVKTSNHKISAMRKFSHPREMTPAEQKDTQQKRRKPQPPQESAVVEKRISLGKKEEINKRAQIIKKLKRHEASWPFRSPVNPKVLDIPNYLQIVLAPIDLQTIQEKIKQDKYQHPSEIQRDITQMFLNSYKFNQKNDTYFATTAALEGYYHDLLREVEQVQRKELPDRQKKKEQAAPLQVHNVPEKANQFNQIQKQIGNLLKRSGEFCNNKKTGRQRPSYFSTKNDYNITLKQKKQLTVEIRRLDSKQLQRVYSIIRSSPSHSHHHLPVVAELDESKANGESIEQVYGVDLEKLDQKTLRQLQNYVRLLKNNIIIGGECSGDQSREVRFSFE